MRAASISSRTICRLLLAAGLMGVVGVIHLLAAQTFGPEGVNVHPSDYQHPVLTWNAPVGSFPSPVNPPPSASSSYDHANESDTSLSRKLRSIIIPELRLEQTKLSDALEFLRQESCRLDTEPNLDQRGVRIDLITHSPSTSSSFVEASPPSSTSEVVIPGLPMDAGELSPAALPATAKYGEIMITFTMRKIPLLEALRYVAQQVGMTVEVGTDQVWLVPLRVSDDLETEIFRVRPRWLSVHREAAKLLLPTENLAGDNQSNKGVDARPFLELQGVMFPPGASARYLLKSRRLIVRDTSENVDMVRNLLSLSSEELDLAPESTNP